MNWQILNRHYSCLGVIIPMTLVVVRDFYPYVWHIHPSDWKCVIWCRLLIPITVLPTTTTTPRKAQPSWSLFWPLFSLPKDASLSPTDFTHCPTPIWGHQSHMVASVWTHDREGRCLCFKAHPVPDENPVCNKTWPPHIPGKYPGAVLNSVRHSWPLYLTVPLFKYLYSALGKTPSDHVFLSC